MAARRQNAVAAPDGTRAQGRRPRRRLGRLLPPAGCAALALLASPARAQAAPPEPSASPHAEVRGQLLSEFKYAPPQGEPSAPAPFLAPGAAPAGSGPPEAATDVVNMAPYTVREMVRMETLHADLAQERADARTAATMARLGVGIHQVAVGKLHFFEGTIFYIPFVVGVGFAF